MTTHYQPCPLEASQLEVIASRHIQTPSLIRINSRQLADRHSYDIDLHNSAILSDLDWSTGYEAYWVPDDTQYWMTNQRLHHIALLSFRSDSLADSATSWISDKMATSLVADLKAALGRNAILACEVGHRGFALMTTSSVLSRAGTEEETEQPDIDHVFIFFRRGCIVALVNDRYPAGDQAMPQALLMAQNFDAGIQGV